ncbi:hypothetical protein CK486_17015 [Pseudomonas sp. HAR-UPW-AIA-41]|uniref:chalcone isomerase family protein n=1 Tax=Pseudomonas sp. HAR-UPW-AIA-41 TaxID=1985301 RepID=UPI000BB3D8E7|nr:chalcone isomerase family protein [Pseudomonas sp. HAR-UPW-AIA-41]PAV46764.1 hypothetical protein CK486_17015 [Pseudomonas sp. HAR-UPW-AIA-41]
MRLLTLCLLSLLPLLAQARSIDQIEIAEQLSAGQELPALQLNGAATRYFFGMVPVYIGALYLEQPANNSQQIITQDSAKRMQFVMRRDVRARKIAEALSDALSTNLDEAELRQLQPQIDQLMALYGNVTLHKGDISSLDYLPGQGTRLIMSGQDKGRIPGKRLYDAVLKVWIGPSPVSREFKASILGGAAPTSARFDSAENKSSMAATN